MPVKANIDTDSIFRFFLPEGPGLKYKRLAQGIEESIRNGVLRQGVKLPPHRILADKLGVTAGTVSRAYGELERMGLVESTAILMPSQVVPQLIHTTRNRTAVTRLATRTCRLLIVRA